MKLEAQTDTISRITTETPEDHIILGALFGRIARSGTQPPTPASSGQFSLSIPTRDLVRLAAGVPVR